MQLTVHGAGKEVGRSCLLIDNAFLLDAGLKITDRGNEYPTFFDVRQLQAVLISHAHLDHTGALPLFNHDGLNCPVFATAMTRLTTNILLEDSLHIELIRHTHPGYAEKNILNVLQHFKDVLYNKPFKINNDITVQFFDAGHIPGSASILVQYKGKRILYTGDINYQSSLLLNGACYNPGVVDVMITESTYGDRTHPNREESEQHFLTAIKETLENKGSVLIPSFAVGRAQELMLLLSKAGFECPIYLDGMARKVTDLYLSAPSFVKDRVALQAAQKRVQYIFRDTDRKRALQEPSIIISPSGMVTGGPAMEYLKLMFFHPSHAILLTGYQGEGTNGRLLLEEKCVYVDGKKVRWEGRLEQFDFSAHAGQDLLVSAIQLIKPQMLILNHGDPISIDALALKLKKSVKRIIAPDVGETLTL